MVACVALAVQPLVSLEAPMTASAGTVGIVEQLKQQLLTAVDNDDEEAVLSAVSEMEKMGFTRELLESTRFGATVNDVRRRITEKWPAIAKRCRALIKSWQQLIQSRPGSSCASSNNGTPNIAGRRLTPCTPVNKRVTSTGTADTRQTLSPSGNSYAPRPVASPAISQQLQSAIHKSQSVGAELSRKADETPRNGKRKAEDLVVSGQMGSSAGLKRTKTVASQLASPAAATRTESVLAARRAVQSTADLISQLSSNLPEHMSIEQDVRKHEEKVKREQADEELAISLSTVPTASPYLKGKRKYERKQQKPAPTTPTPTTPSIVEGPRGGLILRIARPPLKEEEEEEELPSRHNSPMPPVLYRQQPVSEPSSSLPTPISSRPSSSKGGKVDWMAMLPSLDALREKARLQKAIEPNKDPKQSYVVKVRDRLVLALPYLSDVDPKPDFLLHKYPNPMQYYAEENFMYGSERPKE